jgi:hypothetical protein
MTARFRAGSAVEFVATRRHGPAGVFEIVRELPLEGSEPRYRVKSIADGHERVAAEHELSEPKASYAGLPHSRS